MDGSWGHLLEGKAIEAYKYSYSMADGPKVQSEEWCYEPDSGTIDSLKRSKLLIAHTLQASSFSGSSSRPQ